MLLDKFINGTNYTIGVELELRVLNNKDFSLCDCGKTIINSIDSKYKDNLSGEFLASMLEINTPVFEKPSQINTYLQEFLPHIASIASKKDKTVIASGSYALRSSEVSISENIRYLQLYEEHQKLLQKFTICGLHIHVGFENFEDALGAFNFSLKYLPLFVALSASSLFYDGENTGIDSYRTKIFEQLPKGSIPEYFESHEKMQNLYELLKLNEVIESEKDVWWDVRIQPKLKTLEFRICDSMVDTNRIEVLVALIQGMCRLAKYKECEKLPMQILKQNMWSACRHSMDGDIIYNKEKLTIKEALKQLVEELKDKDLLYSKELVEEYIQKESISQQMRELYCKSSSLEEVERVGELR